MNRKDSCLEIWRDELAALLPHYAADGGNCTLICTTGGEVIHDSRTVKWNLRRLARSYSLDLEAIRCNYGRYLGLSQGVPLPLSPSLILVPLKLRRPVGRHDGSCGYLNCLAVEELSAAGPQRCRLLLRGNHRLDCLYSELTARKRLKAGEILGDCLRGELERAFAAGGTASPGLPREWWALLESLVQAMLASREKNGTRRQVPCPKTAE